MGQEGRREPLTAPPFIVMNWKVGTGLGLLAAEALAVLYLCIPKNWRRITGPGLIAAAVVGVALGALLVEPPYALHVHQLFPFDPNDDLAFSLLDGWLPFADFFVGAGFPFMLLAAYLLTRRDKGPTTAPQ